MVAIVYRKRLGTYGHISDLQYDQLPEREVEITDRGKFVVLEVYPVSRRLINPPNRWNSWQPFAAELLDDAQDRRLITNIQLGRLPGRLDEQLLDRITGNIKSEPQLAIVRSSRAKQIRISAS